MSDGVISTTGRRRGWNAQTSAALTAAVALAVCAGCDGKPPADEPIGTPGTWQLVRTLAPDEPSLRGVAADRAHNRYVVVGWDQTILAGRGTDWTPIPLGGLLDDYPQPSGMFERVFVGDQHTFVTGGLGFYAGGVIDVGGDTPTIAFGDPPVGTGPFIFGGPASAMGGSESDLWIGGSAASGHFDGKTWTATAVPFSLTALWTEPNGRPWAVSPNHILVRAADGGWLQDPALTDDDSLFDIWGDGRGAMFVAGAYLPASDDTGVIWSRASEGAAWTRLAEAAGTLPVGTGRLLAVWGRRADDVYAAGRQALLHFDGTSWRREALYVTRGLSGIAGLDRETVVVGNEGIWARQD